MATRYRQLEAPSLLQTGLVDSGAAERAASLSRAFSEFSNMTAEVGIGMNVEQRQKEGAAEGAAGTPKLREGWRATLPGGQAYNNAALRSYALRSEAELDEAAARLETDAANDPQKFSATMQARRREVLKSAPKGTEQLLGELYDRRISAGVQRLAVAQATEVREMHRKELAEGIERSISRIGELSTQTDPESVERYSEEQVRLGLLIDGAEMDGTLSAVEAGTARNKASRQITVATVRSQFAQTLRDPYGKPMEFLSKLKEANRTSEALAPAEEEALMDTLLGDMRDHAAFQSALNDASAAQQEAVWAESERKATEKLIDGSLSNAYLLDLVRNNAIKPSTARDLRSTLESKRNAPAASDPEMLFHYRTNVLAYEEDTIRNDDRLSWDARADLIRERQRRINEWEGASEGRRGYDMIDEALRIPPGAILMTLPKEQLVARDKARDAYYRAVTALPPAERQGKALEIAEGIVRQQIKTVNTMKIETREITLQRLLADKESGAITDEDEQAELDRRILATHAQIARLRDEVNKK